MVQTQDWKQIGIYHQQYMSNPNWIYTYRGNIAHHYMTYYPYDNKQFITQYYNDIVNNGINIPFSDTLTGGPLYIEIDNKIITQDIITTAEEIHTIETQIDLTTIQTIIEIGGGYGRTCWFILTKYPQIQQYTIVDIEPAQIVAKYHLNNSLQQNDFEKICFISPEQFTDNQKIDLSISISVLDELSEQYQQQYLDTIQKISTYFYLKCNKLNQVIKLWNGPQGLILPQSKSVPYHTPMPQMFFRI